MMQELRDHLVWLAEELDTTVSYEMSLRCDSPNDSWPSSSERHHLHARNYKNIYRVSLRQVLELVPGDFSVKTED